MKKNRRFTLFTLAIVFAVVSIAAINFNAKGQALKIDPNNFVSEVDNPYFPLTPGRHSSTKVRPRASPHGMK